MKMKQKNRIKQMLNTIGHKLTKKKQILNKVRF